MKNKIKRKTILGVITFAWIFLIYLVPIPTNKEATKKIINPSLIEIKANLKEVYLIDNNNYLARVEIPFKNKILKENIKEIVETLIIGDKNEAKIPNGFRSMIPPETEIISINQKKDTIIIDFTKEILNVEKDIFKQIIESLTFSITDLDGIKNLQILIEGKSLSSTTNNKYPNILNKESGINKEYKINNNKNIIKTTIYYIKKTNDQNYYYVPITKYLNSNESKVKIIIDELSSNNIYENNLMSFLKGNTKLLDHKWEDQILLLNFNSEILADFEKNIILEEVLYSINLSLEANFNISEVIYYANNTEIIRSVIKNIE